MSQDDLARASGVHRVSVSKLERGLLDIGVVALVRLALALDTSVEDLAGMQISDRS